MFDFIDDIIEGAVDLIGDFIEGTVYIAGDVANEILSNMNKKL